MLRKQHMQVIMLGSLAAIAIAAWSIGGPVTAKGADRDQRLPSDRKADYPAGEARIPAIVLNELIVERVQAARFRAASSGDSANDLPTLEELELTCDGEVILIWWKNEDGSIGWDAECCDDC
jgi:hypothetical protein